MITSQQPHCTTERKIGDYAMPLVIRGRRRADLKRGEPPPLNPDLCVGALLWFLAPESGDPPVRAKMVAVIWPSRQRESPETSAEVNIATPHWAQTCWITRLRAVRWNSMPPNQDSYPAKIPLDPPPFYPYHGMKPCEGKHACPLQAWG